MNESFTRFFTQSMKIECFKAPEMVHAGRFEPAILFHTVTFGLINRTHAIIPKNTSAHIFAFDVVEPVQYIPSNHENHIVNNFNTEIASWSAHFPYR